MRDLNPDKSIFILPASSLEVHGYHLPMGMDTWFAEMNAADFAEEFARSHPDWSVVLYPPLTLGTDELPLAGSIEVKPRVLRDALIGFGNSLAKFGFKYIVVTNGHGGPRQSPAQEEACQRVSRKRGVAMIAPSMRVLAKYPTGEALDIIEAELGRPLTEIERESLSTGGEHAAIMETSLMLAYRPELVAESYKDAKMDAPPKVPLVLKLGKIMSWPIKVLGFKESASFVDTVFNSLAGNIGWFLNTKKGYGGKLVTYQGNPSAASAELGRALRRLIARDLLAEADGVITGRMMPSEVHSPFWDIPIIRTDFFRNLGLAVIVLVILLALLALFF